MTECAVSSCARPKRTRGLCPMHYARLLRHGDVREAVPVRGEKSANGDLWCSRCRHHKPQDNFGRNRATKSGYEGVCKACTAERRRERSAERKVVRAAWRAANAERIRRQKAESYRRHRERHRARGREWRQANPERVRLHIRAQNAARYARLKGAPGRATAQQVADRWAYYGGCCWMCGAPATDTDHVKPLAAGGSNWPANLRPACSPCNRAKSAAWPLAAVA